MFETLISSLYFRKGGRCQTRYQAEVPAPSPPGPACHHQDNQPRAERESDRDGTQEKSPEFALPWTPQWKDSKKREACPLVAYVKKIRKELVFNLLIRPS